MTNGDPLEVSGRLFENKGIAQRKEPANGKAQPFLTSGGGAESKSC